MPENSTPGEKGAFAEVDARLGAMHGYAPVPAVKEAPLYADGRPTLRDPETGAEYDPVFVAALREELDGLIRDLAGDA